MHPACPSSQALNSVSLSPASPTRYRRTDLGALVPGFCLSASVQSMEDHGAVLSFGIKV